MSRALDTYYSLKLPLRKHGILPIYSSYDAISTCSFSIAPDKFFDMVERKSIILKEIKSFRFDHSGIIINDEEDYVEADLVIFATGFEGDSKLRNIFTSKWLQDCVFSTTNMAVPLYRYIMQFTHSISARIVLYMWTLIYPLTFYRQCINPRIPQLAILGYGDSLSTLFTSEMMSKWLLCLLEGGFQLPTIEQMEKDVQKWVECTKLYKRKPLRWTCIQATNTWYNDQLCKDMAWNPKRKSGFLAEWFQPYGPADYDKMWNK